MLLAALVGFLYFAARGRVWSGTGKPSSVQAVLILLLFFVALLTFVWVADGSGAG
jgi:hypothetical protein